MKTFFASGVWPASLPALRLSRRGGANLLDEQERREGYVLLFNGKNLDGWDGDPELWSVRDGAIDRFERRQKSRDEYVFDLRAPVLGFHAQSRCAAAQRQQRDSVPQPARAGSGLGGAWLPSRFFPCRRGARRGAISMRKKAAAGGHEDGRRGLAQSRAGRARRRLERVRDSCPGQSHPLDAQRQGDPSTPRTTRAAQESSPFNSIPGRRCRSNAAISASRNWAGSRALPREQLFDFGSIRGGGLGALARDRDGGPRPLAQRAAASSASPAPSRTASAALKVSPAAPWCRRLRRGRAQWRAGGVRRRRGSRVRRA